MSETDRLATAEDLLAMTFEPMSGVEIPSHEQWIEHAEHDRVSLALGLATLRFSNTELAKIIRDYEDQDHLVKLYESLEEIEKFHKCILKDLDIIKTRLLVAMHQAFPDEAVAGARRLHRRAARRYRPEPRRAPITWPGRRPQPAKVPPSRWANS